MDGPDVFARLAAVHLLRHQRAAVTVRYEDSYRLCYLRGPAGIIVALAEQIT